jgi:hypothetical protein
MPTRRADLPARQLAAFIAKFDPRMQRLIRACRATLRTRLPTAHELVYDNYNFFVIGYSPTERPSDSVVSLTANAKGAGLCFIQGASLADPQKLLQGAGRQTRFLRLPSARTLSEPGVASLIRAAIADADPPFRRHGRPALAIRSISKKQRPRR